MALCKVDCYWCFVELICKCRRDAPSLFLVYVTGVVILLSDDSEETKEFIAAVFQPVQLHCERCVELTLMFLEYQDVSLSNTQHESEVHFLVWKQCKSR